jgi:hypothetical protein
MKIVFKVFNSPPDTGGVAAASRKAGEANLSAADGVVAHTSTWLVTDHPGATFLNASPYRARASRHPSYPRRGVAEKILGGHRPPLQLQVLFSKVAL